MSRSRNRFKGSRVQGGFLAMPHSVLNAAAFVRLSGSAVKLLMDLGAQYRGDNNGDLSIAWKLMEPRGWASQTTLHKAKDELLKSGFLFEARKGQRPNKCSLYALTWFDLDVSDKHDAGAKAFMRNAFKMHEPLARVVPRQNAVLTPETGVAAA
ncbi:hypothetical protein EIP75_16105 [Aquabacterium soli]|uniref:Helix-turn-helix domain-containing protein n=1 Tax=Aquabacterium soli TaxID=2493092 RepID=A0A3R8TAH3_9BURK|nr:hypothetical protein [Aquabacterium soli]RRS03214.1 hypothetical protein EIP75_16105 [Aquabacterium soli]